MATDRHSRQESALKFFLSVATFQQEAQQYTDSDNPLRKFLPHCRDIIPNHDARCSSALSLAPLLEFYAIPGKWLFMVSWQRHACM